RRRARLPPPPEALCGRGVDAVAARGAGAAEGDRGAEPGRVRAPREAEVRVRRLGLRIVDGLELDYALRAALRPGELAGGRRLPRWFFEVDSFRRARETNLAEHFTLNEFVNVDVREAPVLLQWPRYVP